MSLDGSHRVHQNDTFYHCLSRISLSLVKVPTCHLILSLPLNAKFLKIGLSFSFQSFATSLPAWWGGLAASSHYVADPYQGSHFAELVHTENFKNPAFHILAFFRVSWDKLPYLFVYKSRFWSIKIDKKYQTWIIQGQKM